MLVEKAVNIYYTKQPKIFQFSINRQEFRLVKTERKTEIVILAPFKLSPAKASNLDKSLIFMFEQIVKLTIYQRTKI